jgi:hypothetical protein
VKVPFSQRHKARAAAIAAAARYPQDCAMPDGRHVREFWDYVICAAIDALDEPNTSPQQETSP